MQAPTDGQVSQETALAQQITKGQAREIMQKYMPVPETALQTHCSSLVSIAVKHKQMHIQVGPEPALRLSLFSLSESFWYFKAAKPVTLQEIFTTHSDFWHAARANQASCMELLRAICT